jgi:Flp pilus assembly protein TadG
MNRPNIKSPGARRRRNQRGHAFLELALFAPWVFFLFIGAFDWGFYAYALISTESAARVAAEYSSASLATASNSEGACTAALGVMSKLPNVGTSTTSCGSAPVTVTAVLTLGSDGEQASKASVTYRSLILIPIPGLLTNQLNVTRSVTMRLRG